MDALKNSNLAPGAALHLEGNGSAHYGDWEIMEIMEKYGDLPGVFMALKHLCRKPKVAVDSRDTPRSGLTPDAIRLQDIKKAINYLQREVDKAEGRYVTLIK